MKIWHPGPEAHPVLVFVVVVVYFKNKFIFYGDIGQRNPISFRPCFSSNPVTLDISPQFPFLYRGGPGSLRSVPKRCSEDLCPVCAD